MLTDKETALREAPFVFQSPDEAYASTSVSSVAVSTGAAAGASGLSDLMLTCTCAVTSRCRRIGDVELADGLKRLVQVDLAAVDGVTLRLELVRDVGRGDRTEELLVLAGLALEGEDHFVELRRKLLGADLLLRGLAKGRGLHLLDDSLVGGGRFDGELFGKEVVAAITVSDLDHVAPVSELEDIFLENDFHWCSPKFQKP